MIATTLRQVLNYFEAANQPLSLQEIARDLNVTPGMLEGMIAHWVRKGKLREVIDCAEGCSTCSGVRGCPFIPANLPRRYQLASANDFVEPGLPARACPHCG